MIINTRQKGNTLYIMLDGELDEYASKYAKQYLDEAFDNSIYDNVVFDMKDLSFMDSTGIGVLLGRYKKLRNSYKQAYIANPNATIEKIINMSGIYEIMPKIS